MQGSRGDWWARGLVGWLAGWLVWLGLAWLGLAWLGLAWLGLASGKEFGFDIPQTGEANGVLTLIKEGPKGCPGLKTDFQTIPIAIPIAIPIDSLGGIP